MSHLVPVATVMEGTGNRFVLMPETTLAGEAPSDVVRRWAGRDQAIDGLLVVSEGSDEVNCEVDVFNADGTAAEMCGNGLRCVAFLMADQPGHSHDLLRIRMGDHDLQARVIEHFGDHGVVSLTMPEPEVRPTAYGFDVEVGNPHRVVLEESPSAVTDWEHWFHRHPAYRHPEVNLHRVTLKDDHTISMGTWERGVGPTPACGSGAVAAVAALRTRGVIQSPVEVIQAGGRLRVLWRSGQEGFTTIGPVVRIGGFAVPEAVEQRRNIQ